jgi:vacuolar-type H+-ATPase subunit C/Vma6
MLTIIVDKENYPGNDHIERGITKLLDITDQYTYKWYDHNILTVMICKLDQDQESKRMMQCPIRHRAL